MSAPKANREDSWDAELERIGETAVRHAINLDPGIGLLGMAATRSLAATLAMLLIADLLTRVPVIWR